MGDIDAIAKLPKGTIQYERRSTALERHIQIVIMAVVLGVISWVALSVTQLMTISAKLEERTSHVYDSITELKTEQTRSQDNLVSRLRNIKDLLLDHEKRIIKLETGGNHGKNSNIYYGTSQ